MPSETRLTSSAKTQAFAKGSLPGGIVVVGVATGIATQMQGQASILFT